MKILKSDPIEREITMSIYCANGEPDSQDQSIIPEDIQILRNAALEWEKDFKSGKARIDIDHDPDQDITDSCELIDNFITEEETMIGETVVPKNCWVATIQMDQTTFDLIENSSGVSMKGSADVMEA